MGHPYITVFTPTYNRKDQIKRLYKSLCNQETMNFEWIIIDDDSVDGTEEMVQEWIHTNQRDFGIRYYKQLHGGKHRAINKGVQLAQGIFFFIVDSDDYLMIDAITMVEGWGKEVEERDDIAGVSGMRISNTGVIGGIPILEKGMDWIEANNFERSKYNLSGDKAEVYKTSILKKYPFPEFEGEYFVTEAVCWDAIAADGYKVRWYNYPIYHCEYLEDGLTKSGANSMKGHIENYQGYCYYVRQCLRLKPVLDGITEFRQYRKLVYVMHFRVSKKAHDIGMSVLQYFIWSFVVMPFLYCIRIIIRKHKKR